MHNLFINNQNSNSEANRCGRFITAGFIPPQLVQNWALSNRYFGHFVRRRNQAALNQVNALPGIRHARWVWNGTYRHGDRIYEIVAEELVTSPAPGHNTVTLTYYSPTPCAVLNNIPGLVIFSTYDNTNKVCTISVTYSVGVGLHNQAITMLANPDALMMPSSYANTLVSGLVSLQRVGILTQVNIDSIIAHVQQQHLYTFNSGIVSLQQASILTQANFDTLTAHAQYASNLSSGFVSLQMAGILTDVNRDALIEYAQHANALGSGLASLQRAGILTQANIDSIIAHVRHHANTLDNGLVSLQRASILTQANFDTLIAHAKYASNLSSGFVRLQRASILNQANFDTLIAHAQYASNLSSGLASLQMAGILTDVNCDALTVNISRVDAIALAQALMMLKTAGKLTQDGFTQFIQQIDKKSPLLVAKLLGGKGANNNVYMKNVEIMLRNYGLFKQLDRNLQQQGSDFRLHDCYARWIARASVTDISERTANHLFDDWNDKHPMECMGACGRGVKS